MVGAAVTAAFRASWSRGCDRADAIPTGIFGGGTIVLLPPILALFH